jgi:hypothetical protein
MDLPPCEHPPESRLRRVCVHLRAADSPDHYQRFDGDDLRYALVCDACRRATVAGTPVAFEALCAACFTTFEDESFWDSGAEGIVGIPLARIGTDRVGVEHGAPIPAPFDEIAAAHPAGAGWLVWAEGQPWWVDLDGRVHPRPPVSAPAGPLELAASSCGRWAALADHGTGVVWEVETGRVLRTLARGDYHAEQTRFPLAFAPHEGGAVLLHGTDWNRVDAWDPASERDLTARVAPAYHKGRGPDPHYLDYFFGGLAVSPDGARVASGGWVWHPVGMVACWDLRRWLGGHPWESEDGPSRSVVAYRDYGWEAPMCWLDERDLAVWGYGNDDLNLRDAVSIYRMAEAGGPAEPLRWFAGPERGPLHLDGDLLVSVGEAGVTMWAVDAGLRVGVVPGWRPLAFHRASRRYLSRADGGLRISRLVP